MENEEQKKEPESELVRTAKAVYEDQEAEINGDIYKYVKTTHKKRRKVFAFLTKHMRDLTYGDMSFVDTEKYEEIEKIMFDMIIYKDSQLSKLDNHFDTDKHIDNYMKLVLVSLMSISWPLLKGMK